MTRIDRAIDALIPIPSVMELEAADEAKLGELFDWLTRWTSDIDVELRSRHAAKRSAIVI